MFGGPVVGVILDNANSNLSYWTSALTAAEKKVEDITKIVDDKQEKYDEVSELVNAAQKEEMEGIVPPTADVPMVVRDIILTAL